MTAIKFTTAMDKISQAHQLVKDAQKLVEESIDDGETMYYYAARLRGKILLPGVELADALNDLAGWLPEFAHMRVDPGMPMFSKPDVTRSE